MKASTPEDRFLFNIASFLADNFCGWHHARCLEPRQTAHAVVCGDLYEVASKHLKDIGAVTLKADRRTPVLARLALLEAPALAVHPVLLVEGPGLGAVATVCEARDYWVETPALKSLMTEAIRLLKTAASDMKAQIRRAPECVGAKINSAKDLASLAVIAEEGPIVLLVEALHIYNAVGTGAGKRYRHLVGVNAAVAALNDAVAGLLLSPYV